MSNVLENRYKPDYVSPPGETIEDILEERGMTQSELAERMGRPKKTINEIIKGKAAITPETALQLELVLNIPATFWNNREQQYRDYLARKDENERLKGQIKGLKKIPYKAMIKLGWISEFQDEIEQLREIFNFFAVTSFEQWQGIWEKSLSVDFRKSETFDIDDSALTAWLRKGQIEAAKINCAEYDANKFREILQEIRLLTIESPNIFKPKIQSLCAEAGVTFILVPQLPKTRVSGAAYWLNPNKPLIQLSLRYKTNDHFWFNFFHEAGHILLHGKRDVFLETFEQQEFEKQELARQKKEEEANKFACNTLIPPNEWKDFLVSFSKTEDYIINFGNKLRISPGIILGRLQHEKVLKYTYFNDLKQQLNWDVIN
ncbi:HigA family addiction module antitoxin [Crocosphaera sp. UHCC 0190]|uniref:HigA family addiction module antitoxin n=1 Tax=Crocosphaera sp. UHCC 0190 TaxID=3110246 RepID=UPI002B2037B2|nr:HigA family addiction module antitoxin [Crocosphaera sp. UHCC 0190]MEA5510638.1 HigA family addiction module antitoxin [Crocosphaera sp. UHCC 0190]